MKPKIYVSTYAKYNNGSLKGAWIDLEDEDSFFEECKKLHSDEADPELMFQDTEDIPGFFVDESSIDDRLWEWLELDDYEKKIWENAMKAAYPEITFHEAQNCFAGTAESTAEFTENLIEESGYLPKDFPTWIVIDYDDTWGSNLRYDYYYQRDKETGEYFFYYQR